jgi:hypothetical protein
MAALPGGVKVPAATDCAVIELTSFNLRAASCSHGIAGPTANAGFAKKAKVEARTMVMESLFIFVVVRRQCIPAFNVLQPD